MLDYALVYKKLYCFIYICYRCGFTNVNQELVPNIIDTLLQAKDPASLKIVQIILREPKLSRSLGPVILVASIRHGRLDIVEDVY